MIRFDLVIFDCDGVLVDSERITNQVFCRMLNELGLAVTLEDMFERFVGLSMPQCLELIKEMHGAPPPDSFVSQFRKRTAEALERQIKPIPGIVEVLSNLSIPYCVASSGEHEKIRLSWSGRRRLLRRLNLWIFSVADVERPKPAPDVFLLAAERLRAKPSRCAVVEDTPTGVRAAVAAGMHVFGFSANTPEQRLKEAGAHEVFSNMHLFPQLLNEAKQTVPADNARAVQPNRG